MTINEEDEDVGHERSELLDIADENRELRAEVERIRYQHGLMVAALEQIRDVAYSGTDDVALLRIQAVAVNVLKLCQT